MNNNILNDTATLLLCAGKGTRLAPFTNSTPKAAVRVCDLPSVYFSLQACRELGLKSFFFNSHQFHKPIKELISNFPNQDFEYFINHEPELLGSGGALVAMRSKLKSYKNLLIYNPDVIADVNLGDLFKHHQKTQAFATLVSLDNPPKFKKKTIETNNHGNILQFISETHPASDKSRLWSGAGVFLINSQILDYLPKSGASSLITGLQAALDDQQKMQIFGHKSSWFDIGDSLESWFGLHDYLHQNFYSNPLSHKVKDLHERVHQSQIHFHTWGLTNFELESKSQNFNKVFLFGNGFREKVHLPENLSHYLVHLNMEKTQYNQPIHPCDYTIQLDYTSAQFDNAYTLADFK